MDIVLRTERLVLRPLSIEDLDTTHAYASDLNITRHMVYLPNENKEETAQFLQRAASEWVKENPSFYEFAITLDGAHIGAVSVYVENSEGELGWILHAAHHGKGYATEAAKAVMDFAIRELKLTHIIAHCDQQNTASCRVMEKLGMRAERADGIRRNRASLEDSKEFAYGLHVAPAR